MTDLPDANAKMDVNAALPRAQNAPAETADTVMEGTHESENALNSDSNAVANPSKLRKSHLLQRLWEQEQEQEQVVDKSLKVPSLDEQARENLRRSIALALQHVGFQAATTEALESFLLMTETYLHSLAKDVVSVAHAARRSQPIPTDFDLSFARFNLTTSALRPHLRNPVAMSKLAPAYFDPLARLELRGQERDLPLLSDELSGKAEKDAKPYIPEGFPDFPSIHTYRHTPIDVDTVTVQGIGMRYDDGEPVQFQDDVGGADSQQLQLQQTSTVGAATAAATAAAEAGAAGSLRSDPKRIREAAAVEAKQAEEALRSLMRASKINKLKEVRAAAERNSLSKQRYSLWETAMRELIEESTTISQPSTVLTAAALREEIADQSMMVNAEKAFHRKEIPRKPAKRLAQKT
ncbi:bromodomain associated protein [Grosmannia clavigera kw1407]|uniref:Transcription initiation factor TFIID subunit 8 n=1 Tax=Grosmannia clavigera (strain kw1407 / UAMH 11150) TaxID=655863 RepID=F0XHR5_GROCL|nr:bromodomain associated protein [Grosmannia clavigera kw1407]EFX02745.1 bromodomain associated protein [Grosmannia clavigera kw1407]